jgi:CHAT domain-containing protein
MLVKNIPTVVETSVSGTEDSFKALSGQKVSIIHLSTHGFYEKPNLIVYKGNQKFQLSIGKDQDVQASDIQNLDLQWSNAEDVSLSRSGLFLAGASDYLYGELVADNEHEDGILTAKEISRLDLRGLDLVVLSACETGLGDVSGDGVFGLQRGFKKAGAQTLLMSLWKVDDVATELLMTEFYRNFTDGQSKWDSFLNAQQFLRQYNNGQYDKPEFWAAFIMLDGIE